MNPETDIAPEITPEPAAARIQPHAKAFAERAKKLEALSLGELAQRVADGLARLRAGFGLETRAADPLSALFAALPGTELARRGVDLERELAAAQAAALERERAAADVERRSDSLKEALRERSADLATALARAELAPAAQRELESMRARLTEIEAERDRAAGDLARSLAENARIAEALTVIAAERAAARADLATAQAEAAAAAADRRDALGLRDAALARAETVSTECTEALAARDQVAQELATAGVAFDAALTAAESRLEFLRAALGASGAREQASQDLESLDKTAHVERIAALEGEIGIARRERAELAAELARARDDSVREVDVRQRMLTETQRALAERETQLTTLRRDLAWRQREMNALREESGGLRWKLLGGDTAARIARWPDAAEGEARP